MPDKIHVVSSFGLGILSSFFLAIAADAQTVTTKTILADPVTLYEDNSTILTTTVVTYDLEHRVCGQTTWTVIAPGLALPTSTRQVDAQCHEYAWVAIAGGIRSLESNVLQIDLRPRPKAPANARAQ